MAKKIDENLVAQNIKEIIEELGVSATIEVSKEDSTFVVDIDSEDSALLIGKYGTNLESLQFALAVRIKTSTKQDDFDVFVDVNGWRRKKEEKLQQLAQKLEDKVDTSGKEEEVFNLSASERRVIHSFLTESSKVETISEGEGQDRHLIIKPKG